MDQGEIGIIPDLAASAGGECLVDREIRHVEPPAEHIVRYRLEKIPGARLHPLNAGAALSLLEHGSLEKTFERANNFDSQACGFQGCDITLGDGSDVCVVGME